MKRTKSWFFLAVTVGFLFAVGMAGAQPNIGLNAIGGKLGYISPEDPFDSVIGFGAVANLGTLTPQIFLRGFVDYWSKSEKSNVFGTEVESSFSSLTFGASGLYYFAAEGSSFQPYAGGGLGFTISKGKSSAGGYTYSDSDSDISFHVLVGADYPISPNLTGFAEFKYHLNGVDAWGIYGGVLFSLSK
jgi:opacity protein-like surface antigen